MVDHRVDKQQRDSTCQSFAPNGRCAGQDLDRGHSDIRNSPPLVFYGTALVGSASWRLLALQDGRKPKALVVAAERVEAPVVMAEEATVATAVDMVLVAAVEMQRESIWPS